MADESATAILRRDVDEAGRDDVLLLAAEIVATRE